MVRFFARSAAILSGFAPAPIRDRLRGDGVATVTARCQAERARRGVIAAVVAGCAELTNIAGAVIRARAGLRSVIQPASAGRRRVNAQGRTPTMFVDDFSYAWRRIVRQPAASGVTAALLALAIGVSAAMFAVVDAFIIRPAPFRDVNSLSRLAFRSERGSSSYGDLTIVRSLRGSGAFDFVNAEISQGGSIAGDVERSRSGSLVTPGTFEMLGVRAALGRTFAPGEGRPGTDQLVVIADDVWRTGFAGDPAIIGKTIRIDDVPHMVIGVMPPGLRFPHRGGIWRPFDIDQPPPAAAKRALLAFVKRKEGMPDADAIRLADASLAGTSTQRIELRGISAQLLDEYSRQAIVALAVGVALVFVLLCANVTNLVLARTTMRRHELGVAAAMGASRVRLLRQVLYENVALGIVASLAGLVLAWQLVALANRFLPEEILWRTLNPLDLDWRAVAAASVFGIVATLVAGLPPAWLGTGGNTDALRTGQRAGAETPGSRRLTRTLLVVEVAMAVALLAAAGLQLRSFVNLVRADRGIDTTNVIVASLSLPAAHFRDPAARYLFATELQSRLAGVPGVAATALAAGIPPNGGDIHFGEVVPDLPDAIPLRPTMYGYTVAPEFFATYGVTMLQGRTFERGDAATDVIISRALATQLYGDVNPIGRSFTLSRQALRVLGVTAEVRTGSLDPREDFPEIYRPLYVPTARGIEPSRIAGGTLRLGVKCASPCVDAETIRREILAVNANADIRSLQPLDVDFMAQLARPKTAAVLAIIFAGLAVAASAVGLYSVLTYFVNRRTREFGIRAAIGANPRNLARLVFADAARVAALGIATGVAAGWALSRWIGAMQFGVTLVDPITWSVVIAVVLTMVLTASWRPARRAMRVDPVALLRE